MSCGKETETTEVKKIEEKQIQKEFAGNYVTESFEKRKEGYDWMAVKVSHENENEINVSVRSRSDKKKPTCTFDAVAKKMDDNSFYSELDKGTVLFKFSNDTLSISTKEFDNRFMLQYFCSGGGSVMGSYMKTTEKIDYND